MASSPAAMFMETLKGELSRAGIRPDQCDYDDTRGILVIHPDEAESAGAHRVVPVAALAARHTLLAGDAAGQAALMEAAVQAFGHGGADVPNRYADCGSRLLPQIWPAHKIASFQAMLPGGTELPHCGLHGEPPPLQKPSGERPMALDLGVVLVHEYVAQGSAGAASGPRLPVETPVLSNDLLRWEVSFTGALRTALDNLRSRTKAGPAPDKRWEHHASGCGQSCWQDRFDAARAVLLPNLVAKRKRPDGAPEPGGHVVSVATTSCVLAATSKNPLGLCFMGDTLHVQMPKSGGADALQRLSTTPMRLLKMKDGGRGENPLDQKAGEGLVWRWAPYAPGAPPTRTSGEFSVPVDAGEVEAILNAAEAGGTVPVFTHASEKAAGAEKGAEFAAAKEDANALFRAGDHVKAVAAYDRALGLGPPSDADAAVVHSNAAQALLQLAATDPARREQIAAEALRRGARAVELDGTYFKAHARCAAACELLGESAAAAEFRAQADACLAADAATKAAKLREAEEKREEQREVHAARKAAAQLVGKAQSDEAAREAARDALLERERAREREKEEAEAEAAAAASAAAARGSGSASDLAGAGSLGLAGLFGLPGIAAVPEAPAPAAAAPFGASPLLCSR